MKDDFEVEGMPAGWRVLFFLTEREAGGALCNSFALIGRPAFGSKGEVESDAHEGLPA